MNLFLLPFTDMSV